MIINYRGGNHKFYHQDFYPRLEACLQICFGANFSHWSVHVLVCPSFHLTATFNKIFFQKSSVVIGNALPNRADHVDVLSKRFPVTLGACVIALHLIPLAVFAWHVIVLWALPFSSSRGKDMFVCIQQIGCGPLCADRRGMDDCRGLTVVLFTIPKLCLQKSFFFFFSPFHLRSSNGMKPHQ